MRRPIARGDLNSRMTAAFHGRDRKHPARQQAKLLRVIETVILSVSVQSKTLHANVRIISATNANLEDEVAAGIFGRICSFV